MEIVVDASCVIMAYFKDEEGHSHAQKLMADHAAGEISFIAPSLIAYELISACSVAVRRKRISADLGKRLLTELLGLEIAMAEIQYLQSTVFDLSLKHILSAYDSSYIALSLDKEIPLVTGDKRLFNSVGKHISNIRWIGNYY